jgi:hypothetical protein
MRGLPKPSKHDFLVRFEKLRLVKYKRMTDTQVVRKISDDLDLNFHTNEHECIKSMQAIYNGKIWMMPLFAQQLVSYLYEDMPVSDNPRVAAHHLATRGMFVMQKAYQLSAQNDENKEPLGQIEDKENKKSPRILEREPPRTLAREGLCILIGWLYGKQQYFFFLIFLACVCVTHPLYGSINSQAKKYLTCIYVCLVAYTIYGK